jgi:hypothetical protein
MSITTRIARTVAVVTLAASGAIAVAPAVSATPSGPGTIGTPPHCTHGCDGGGFQGPGDFTAPTPDPVVDPQPQPSGDQVVAQPVDAPIVVAQPTFTG